ncbi:CoA-binding protein [Bacillus sp. 1P10SD]|uniref:acetate--CoA ligase family protein n=1 Tax=Bacillus sp. 1P10SD TaxID=3132265 RepID=UPI0039A406A3
MNDDKMIAIQKLLYPKSIALIGATNNPKKSGGRLLAYLTKHRYPHEIYPVNPNETVVQGRKCYKTIGELPEGIDLALVIVPRNLIFSVMEDCSTKGIKTLVIYSSGFAEVGEEGEILQEQLVRKANELGIHICGPNGIGIVNTTENFFGSFSMAMETPDIPMAGRIAFVTQSGAIGGGMLSRIWTENTATSHFISSGNEADLDTADYISYLADDPNTEVICLYLEGIKDGKKFIKALKKAYEKEKPIIVYKNGKTLLGQKAVKSHTGSLAGDFQIYEAVFKQYGVISVREIEQLFDVARTFLTIKDIKGKNVGIVSTSGGACTILADSCINSGFQLPPFSPETEVEMNKLIPEFGVVQNPFDTTAHIVNQPENFRKVIELLLNDPNIDTIVIMLTTVGEPIASLVAEDIVQLVKSHKKSILVSWLVSEALAKNGFQILRKNGIPIFSSPEKAVTCLSYVSDYYLKKKGKVDLISGKGSY